LTADVGHRLTQVDLANLGLGSAALKRVQTVHRRDADMKHLKFSIRDLFALVLLAALGLLAWQMSDAVDRDRVRLTLLHSEIKSLETSLRLDNPLLHQAILDSQDELESLAAMRERSLEHFETLRQKYSALEPREGAVFSIRGIPSLSTDTGPAPVVYRMSVPEQRPVWFKFGVHLARETMTSKTPDDGRGLLPNSPFGPSGPYEIRLPAGVQSISIALGAAKDGAIPLRIALGENTLFRSLFVSPGVSGTSFSHTTPSTQDDVAADQQLPWLLTAKLDQRESGNEKGFEFTVWLSDHSSNFQSFPGEPAHDSAQEEVRQ
jgi:hypothetical protein